MFDIIDWKLPQGAFYGTAQGRNLDAAMDKLTPEERLTVWHVTSPGEHLLFRREADARAYFTAELAAVAGQPLYGLETPAVPERGQCRYAQGEHWKWSRTNSLGDFVTGHITLWRHTETEEATRQARMESAFQAAAGDARKLFARPGQREFNGAAQWTEFLNAPSQEYARQKGLMS